MKITTQQGLGEAWPTLVLRDYPEVKYPEKLPLVVCGNVDTFLVWLKDSEDYCNLHGFFPAFSNKIEVYTKRPFEAIASAREKGVCFCSGLEP